MNNIQKRLKVKKEKYNDFGKYTYRTAEQILEEVKKILPEGYYIILTDEITTLGERYYVKSTAALKKDGQVIESSTAFAREALNKKGMDDAQITGAASSYARKYALSGLFAIDDGRDIDSSSPDKRNELEIILSEFTDKEKLKEKMISIRDEYKKFLPELEVQKIIKERYNEL